MSQGKCLKTMFHQINQIMEAIKTNPKNTKSKSGHIFVINHGLNVQFNVSTKSQLLLHVKNSLGTDNTCC